MEKGKLSSLFTALKSGDIHGPAGIFSPAVFQTLLRHERCRTDRDDGHFSLVVFDIIGAAGSSRNIRLIAERIRERMRSIDEVGWLDDRRIGVLLPICDGNGGEKFALRVTEGFTGRFPFIPWTAYSYPTHWIPGADHRGAGKLNDLDEKKVGGSDRTLSDSERKALENVFGSLFCRRIPAWKRFIDIAGSLFFIALFSPLFVLAALYIQCVSPGKILFKQPRVGYKGKLFMFLKFRTMHENNDSSAHREYVKQLIRGQNPMEKLDGGRDPRIIPGGKIIRKTCIDELPQLFNVLFGSMSLVGPRPCIAYEAEEYMRWHTHRFDILPGMTGLWQVSGKNKLSFEEMIRLDISYADRMSPGRDLKILLKTAPAILGMVLEATLKKIVRKVPLALTEAYIGEKAQRESVHNA